MVNARDAKHVPGRKSDVSDAEWLQRLHEYGLLRPSFRPQAGIAGLRAYLRQRERLLDYAAAHIGVTTRFVQNRTLSRKVGRVSELQTNHSFADSDSGGRSLEFLGRNRSQLRAERPCRPPTSVGVRF